MHRGNPSSPSRGLRAAFRGLWRPDRHASAPAPERPEVARHVPRAVERRAIEPAKADPLEARPVDAGARKRANAPRPLPSDILAGLEAAVQKTRGEFVERLAEYHEKLDEVVASGLDGSTGEDPSEEAMYIAHRIAGVGKTLGFPELGNAARETESAIAAYLSKRGSDELRAASMSGIIQLVGLIADIRTEYSECCV